MNCWEPLRAFDATAELETADVNALKNQRIGQSAAKLLFRKDGEGSTTRIDHLQG
ncbi:hypothetical protein GLW08_11735 [Pontibacillus yanchengensis]|uniref:Uncharacterized protein n=1 Tax=Pontibacillus yanchengensis TaxID=462910 RepID=A0ACC7VJ85_9BACI|nr:hypothetical protein [Pontibacillus yanchengensis]MYL54009.1 hypothetical protein [Pontibacillus yanchengensis]